MTYFDVVVTGVDRQPHISILEGLGTYTPFACLARGLMGGYARRSIVVSVLPTTIIGFTSTPVGVPNSAKRDAASN